MKLTHVMRAECSLYIDSPLRSCGPVLGKDQIELLSRLLRYDGFQERSGCRREDLIQSFTTTQVMSRGSYIIIVS